MLTEHIKNVLNGKPVYEIEIPYVEGAMAELLLPLSGGCTIIEDSDRLEPTKGCDVMVVSNSMSSTAPDNLSEVEFIISPDAIDKRIVSDAAKVFGDELRERMLAGEYNPMHSDFRLPVGFVDRIKNMFIERKKVLDQKMVWFTFGVENRECYSSWPVGAYRFGASNHTCFNLPKVKPALMRLMKREVIQSIRVTGPIPQHWYFGTMYKQ